MGLKKLILHTILMCFSCCGMGWFWCCRQKEMSSRTVWVGRDCSQKFPANVIRNQKYNIFSFLPLVSKIFCQYTSEMSLCSAFHSNSNNLTLRLTPLINKSSHLKNNRDITKCLSKLILSVFHSRFCTTSSSSSSICSSWSWLWVSSSHSSRLGISTPTGDHWDSSWQSLQSGKPLMISEG